MFEYGGLCQRKKSICRTVSRAHDIVSPRSWSQTDLCFIIFRLRTLAGQEDPKIATYLVKGDFDRQKSIGYVAETIQMTRATESL